MPRGGGTSYTYVERGDAEDQIIVLGDGRVVRGGHADAVLVVAVALVMAVLVLLVVVVLLMVVLVLGVGLLGLLLSLLLLLLLNKLHLVERLLLALLCGVRAQINECVSARAHDDHLPTSHAHAGTRLSIRTRACLVQEGERQEESQHRNQNPREVLQQARSQARTGGTPPLVHHQRSPYELTAQAHKKTYTNALGVELAQASVVREDNGVPVAEGLVGGDNHIKVEAAWIVGESRTEQDIG